MKKTNFKKINGYIEGYYGKILKWSERYEIIKTLKKNKMNFYFYCPKEDIFQRRKWRRNHPKNWFCEFEKFYEYAKQNNVQIIVGISPGLDFNFKNKVRKSNLEFKKILKKINYFLKIGITNISILFDDIPVNDFLREKKISEGFSHAELTNKIKKNLNINLFTVPRIYSDELSEEDSSYIKDFFTTLDKDIYVFYCGRFIVSSNFTSSFKEVKKRIILNKVIFWDNFYANDYCPKRLIIGPWLNKKLKKYSMINGTGMLHTDKLILEIVNACGKNNKRFDSWKIVILKNKIPKRFVEIYKYFSKPNYSYERKINIIKQSKNTMKIIDELLWDWKAPLSIEWYSYLLNLKQDLQILNDELPFNRVLKTQTNPLQIKFLTGGKVK